MLASLYGELTRITWSTPGSVPRWLIRSTSPTTPITVRSSPSLRKASRPFSSTVRFTPSISSRVAVGRITTIIRLPPLALLRRCRCAVELVPRPASGKQKTQELALPASAGTSASAGEIYSPASYPLAIKPHCVHWFADCMPRLPACQPVWANGHAVAEICHARGEVRPREAAEMVGRDDQRPRRSASAVESAVRPPSTVHTAPVT